MNISAIWIEIWRTSAIEVKQILLQPPAQVTVATSTIVAGVATIVGVVHSIVGIIAVIIGMCLTCVLIYVIWERRKLDKKNKLLERENLLIENDILKLKRINLSNSQYREAHGLKLRRKDDIK